MNNSKITIIGSGAMGTTIAKLLFENNFKNILIYGINKIELSNLEKGTNPTYFSKSLKLPKFRTTSNIEKAVKECEYIILAIPSKNVPNVILNILNSIKNNKNIYIVNFIKGYYPKSNKSVHSKLIELSKKNNKIKGVVSLWGPCHAEELILKKPTIVEAISNNHKLILKIKNMFQTSYFNIIEQKDLISAEIASAYKNIIAIISGISKGLNYGVNTNAAIITKGLQEISLISQILGGNVNNVYSFIGCGDLIATATSELSRNYSFGIKLVKIGLKALNSNNTIEGLYAIDYLLKISNKHNIYLPLLNFLNKLLKGKENSKNLVNYLFYKK